MEALIDIQNQHPVWDDVRYKENPLSRVQRKYYWYEGSEFLRIFVVGHWAPNWTPWGNYFAPSEDVFKVGSILRTERGSYKSSFYDKTAPCVWSVCFSSTSTTTTCHVTHDMSWWWTCY